jgi:hypothetical protein
MVCTLAVLASYLPPSEPRGLIPGWTAQPASHRLWTAFTGLEQADARWYLGVASSGYQPRSDDAAFFPGFPLLVRWVGVLLGGHWLLAAYLVSSIALVVAFSLLYRLTAQELSPQLARRAVLLLALNPVAVFLYAPYSESLFLAITLSFFLALRRERWHLAAATAACASLTRATGWLLVVPALAIACERAHNDGTSWRQWRRAGFVVGAALGGGLAYVAYWWGRADAGRPFAAQQHGWHRTLTWPWATVTRGVSQGVAGATDVTASITTLYAVLVVVSGGLIIWAVRRYPHHYGAYGVVTLALPLCVASPTQPFMSVPRFVMVAFPIWWALAELTNKHMTRILVTSCSVLLAVLFTLQFASGYDVL